MRHHRGAGWFAGMRRRLAFMPTRLTALSLAVMAGIALAAVGLLDLAWVQVRQGQERYAWELANAVSDDFDKSFSLANNTVDAISSGVLLDRPSTRPQDIIRQRLRANPDEFAGLLAIDDGDKIELSTVDRFKRGSVADELKAAEALRVLTLADPVIVGGEKWLPMLRPIGNIGGRDLAFVGLLRLSYFQRRLVALHHNAATMIAIFERDGLILAGVPALGPNLPLRVPQVLVDRLNNDASSIVIARSPLNHSMNLTAVFRNSACPVGVVVVVPITVLIQLWLPRAVLIAVLAALLLLLMVILHLTLATELYCRHQAETRATASTKESSRVGAHYRLLAENSSDVIVQSGIDAVCRYVSPSMADLLGWTPEDLVGKDARRLIHPDDLVALEQEIKFLMMGKGPIRPHYRHLHKDGRYVWVEAHMRVVDVGGVADSFVSNVRDITERVATERRPPDAAAKMARIAATDQLTGLANRRRFNEELEREWRRAAREELPLSLLLIDIDFFKLYNDSYGHQGGDEMLKTVASAIAAALHRSPDLVARWGGEEFVVLLPVTGVDGAVAGAERARALVDALAVPHRGAESGILSVSVGVATTFPSQNRSPELLIAEADANLYEAKRLGRNRVGAPPIEPVMWAPTEPVTEESAED